MALQRMIVWPSGDAGRLFTPIDARLAGAIDYRHRADNFTPPAQRDRKVGATGRFTQPRPYQDPRLEYAETLPAFHADPSCAFGCPPIF